MELIHNSTGGRVPRYWRPPYGDVDVRVRAIALEVFGLETVVWNAEYAGFPSCLICYEHPHFLALLIGRHPHSSK